MFRPDIIGLAYRLKQDPNSVIPAMLKGRGTARALVLLSFRLVIHFAGLALHRRQIIESISRTPGDAPVSRLYKNNRDRPFTDVTRETGLGRTGWGAGCLKGTGAQ
jgi:hypothetical protein